jgi:hypothetical protein
MDAVAGIEWGNGHCYLFRFSINPSNSKRRRHLSGTLVESSFARFEYTLPHRVFLKKLEKFPTVMPEAVRIFLLRGDGMRNHTQEYLRRFEGRLETGFAPVTAGELLETDLFIAFQA